MNLYGTYDICVLDHLNKDDDDTLEKRDTVGQNEYNSVSFEKGGLLTQYCKYDGYSETLTAPKDIQMVYDAVNGMPGYWYYNSGHRHHWVLKDNNKNVDISEGLLQFYDSPFETKAFVQPWQLCYGDHDEL